jgi:glycosyltransferase involved in cell wall biosynthesis
MGADPVAGPVSPVELSVVIPCLNAASTLGHQLDALASERPRLVWEVVVVDNGSTDATVAIAQSYASKFDHLCVVHEARPGRHHACNAGWRAASGAKIIFVDADDVIEPGFIDAMATALDSHDQVAGRLRVEYSDGVVPGMEEITTSGLMPDLGFLPYVPGGACGVWKSRLEAVGGFDADVPFAEDADLSWRLQLSGCSVGVADDAVVRYHQRSDLRSMFRQHRRYGRAYAFLYAKYRDRGMPRRSAQDAMQDWMRVIAATPSLGSPDVRVRFVRRLARNIGRIEGSIRARVVYL